MVRDFTYIDDIVHGVILVPDTPTSPDPVFNSDRPAPSRSSAPYRVLNIGNNQPNELMAYIAALEDASGRAAEKNFLPRQRGDVPATFADTEALRCAVGFRPSTPVNRGIKRFVEWYRSYYGCCMEARSAAWPSEVALPLYGQRIVWVPV